MAEATEQRIKAVSEMVYRIDDILSRGDYQELARLKVKIDLINALPVNEKTELELPVGLVKLKPRRFLWWWVTGQ